MTDYIGNLFGIWTPEGCAETEPVMTGSHIDTVINAGQFDGCYGVLAALEVVETLKASGFVPARPIAVVAFTDEEGVRYLRQLNIGLLQGLAQGKAQRRRKNDSNRAVKNRCRDLQHQRCGRSGGGKTADQQPIVGKGLEKVKDIIGKAAQRGGNGAAAVFGPGG